MAQVVVTINEREFTVACDDGEEEHLLELVHHLDRHVAELRNSMGQLGDARLLLMAGLLVADELWEAMGRVQELEEEIRSLRRSLDENAGAADGGEPALVEVLASASKRLEDVAEKLEAT